MKLATVFVEQLDREAELTRRALELVPEGQNDWKPHSKSMPLGILAHLVATMLSWIAMIVWHDEVDVKRPEGAVGARTFASTQELIEAHDKAVENSRRSLRKATDKFLQGPWTLLAGGHVLQEQARYLWILDNFKYLAHYRGQLTIYLRMLEQPSLRELWPLPQATSDDLGARNLLFPPAPPRPYRLRYDRFRQAPSARSKPA